MGQCPPNSIHYLLNLWQRMVASVPYVKAQEPHLLETYTPEVTRAYITSRLDAVAQIVNEGLDSPFEDVGMIQQQLEQLSTIARCEYEKTCALINCLIKLHKLTTQTHCRLVINDLEPYKIINDCNK